MDCIIQVTQWMDSPHLLEELEKYLSSKGFSLTVKQKKMKTGVSYSLFRNLTLSEKEEIKQKKYIISRNSLERRDTNGRRIR